MSANKSGVSATPTIAHLALNPASFVFDWPAVCVCHQSCCLSACRVMGVHYSINDTLFFQAKLCFFVTDTRLYGL